MCRWANGPGIVPQACAELVLGLVLIVDLCMIVGCFIVVRKHALNLTRPYRRQLIRPEADLSVACPKG